jgi:hypothetical protein
MNKSIENKLTSAVLAIKEKNSSQFSRKGIIVSNPQIDDTASSIDGHNTEFRLCFYKEDSLIDVIEFFIYKDSLLICSFEEIIRFLEKEFHRILNHY